MFLLLRFYVGKKGEVIWNRILPISPDRNTLEIRSSWETQTLTVATKVMLGSAGGGRKILEKVSAAEMEKQCVRAKVV